MPEAISPERLAPCGVNCLACSAHLSAKTPCPGCRAPAETQKRKSCQNCAKKNCAFEKGLRWCFECTSFPCAKIKSLSKNYVKNYGVDLVADGLAARADREALLRAHRERYTCAACGGVVDQHRRRCSECRAATPPAP